jgi:hypothetical protein
MLMAAGLLYTQVKKWITTHMISLLQMDAPSSAQDIMFLHLIHKL